MLCCMYILNLYIYVHIIIVLNSEVTDLKACLQKQELQLHSKTQELKDALSKVSNNYITNEHNGNITTINMRNVFSL